MAKEAQKEVLKKITAKIVMGSITKPTKETDLFTVFGIARGVRTGVSTFGPWTALVGNFEAKRLNDGKVFASPQVIIPEPFNGMIAGQVQDGKHDSGVRFAYIVGVKPAAKGRPSQTGYEFYCKPVVKAEEDDALNELREQADEAAKSSAKANK